ncbi:hypothetical protein [Nocardiopsis quinghaiensis]|nr:hypothetical protein [Nocardiopsis quinghaiensis]
MRFVRTLAAPAVASLSVLTGTAARAGETDSPAAVLQSVEQDGGNWDEYE